MEANVYVDPSLGIEMRSSVEFPNLFISKCGQWLYNSVRKNFLKKYYRVKKYKYLKCCSANWYLHRLVGLAWVHNPCPEVFKTVDHIDHDTQNNSAFNLRWCSVQLNCIHRQTKNCEKIVKKNGAVFYRSRSRVGGKVTSEYYRTRVLAVCGAKKTRDDNFARIYKAHIDARSTAQRDFAVNQRAPHHVLWTDIQLETPEGFEPDDTRVCGYSASRGPKFTVHHQ